MVRAVNIDESPNTLGTHPEEPKSQTVSISNPDEEVEFDVDTGSDDLILNAVSDKAIGGTELMKKWLFKELDKRDTSDLKLPNLKPVTPF